MKRATGQHGRGSRRIAVALVVSIAITLMAMHPAGRADGPAVQPPMPPLPEDVHVDSSVQPASLEVATPLPLDGARHPSAATGRTTPTSPMGNWSVLAAIGSAFVVLAAFRFWQSRRTIRELPSDVFEILGEAPLGNQHAVRVVRFGPRTLLVGVSAAGCQTLATLDDPQVTERIVGACSGARTSRPSRVPPRPLPAAGSHGGREAR